MLATTEIPEEQAVAVTPPTTNTKESLAAAAEPVPSDPTTTADNDADESCDDDSAMDMDVDGPLEEFVEEDMAEIDASNIVPARTRGVKIDFASMPELMAADDDDEDDEDAVVESAMEED
ncbi:hypothetical protein HDU87_002127 [Geranomyces variabilis]|uniref:Histone chaperone domain-containing protein n=1 Tax=Geranomyces variabilis TaxID=109894 RepID=A0AAD5XTG3_9FUNG|nr:hypothetical protein HDU87_002127 [Geranomyces variabilis]